MLCCARLLHFSLLTTFINSMLNIFSFKNLYFSSTAIQWNKLDKSIQSFESFSIFKKSILKFIRQFSNSILNCHNPKGIKLLTRSRLSLGNLCDHKFKHSVQDSLNPICKCRNDIKTTFYYLIHCPLFSNERIFLINNIQNINSNILNLNDYRFSEVLLFGNSSFQNTKKYIYFTYHNQIYRLI